MEIRPNTKPPVVVSREEMMRQWELAGENRQLLQHRMGHPARAWVKTFGCQGNVADSEKIMGLLLDMGCEPAVSEQEADIILYNTCAVRENAEVRLMSMVGELRRLKQKNPTMIVGLCGCMMQQEEVVQQIRRSYPFVELIFGTHVLHTLPQMINRLLKGERRVVDCYEGEGRENPIAEGLPIQRSGGVQASLQIMYGCDNFCSYCIVPYVRGREKSRHPDAIVAECRELIEQGYKEITLLGQNVNSYGKGLPEKVNFSELLRRIDAIDGDYRLRFMTSHPKDATHELFDTIAESRHICHYIHLPCQSGSSRVLKAMNRHYDREKYLDLIRYAKEKMPDLSLTSDIIVGFPGETYEEFCETLSLIREVEFTSLFTFIFSPRPGTRAAEMEDPVTYKEKTQWFSELLKTQEEIAAKRCASMVGSTERVLIEERNEKNGLLSGRTASSIIVEFPGEDEWIGEFKNVKVTEARNWILRGECVD